MTVDGLNTPRTSNKSSMSFDSMIIGQNDNVLQQIKTAVRTKC